MLGILIAFIQKAFQCLHFVAGFPCTSHFFNAIFDTSEHLQFIQQFCIVVIQGFPILQWHHY